MLSVRDGYAEWKKLLVIGLSYVDNLTVKLHVSRQLVVRMEWCVPV